MNLYIIGPVTGIENDNLPLLRRDGVWRYQLLRSKGNKR